MTITLNSDYDVTLSTALLGYVGETNARPVSVEGLTVDGADRYVLTIDYGDGVQYEVDITGGQWTPTADILRSAQTVSCQIAAKKLSGDEYILVKKSRIFRLRIGAAIGDNAVPSPDVAMDALDRIDAIGRQAHADMQIAVTAADTATTAAENAKKSATAAGVSADTAEQAAERAETAQAAAETSATQADTAMQGAETARAEAVTAQNAAKISAAQASTSAQQTTADKNITAGYAKTAKTNADSTAADRQAVQTLAEQVTADKANVAENAAKVAEDRKTAETAAQTAQAVADSLPEDYVTAVSKIAENTAEIGHIKLTDKELTRRVNALYDIGQGVTHKFETDTDTAYAKTVPTGAKLMSVKSIGGHSEVIDGEIVSAETESVVEQGKNLLNADDYYVSYKQSDGSYVNNFMGFASINIPVGKYIGKTLVATLKATVPPELTSFFWVARIDGARIESSYAKGERVLANTTGIAKLTFTPKTKNDTLAMSYGTGRGDVIVRDIQVELGDTPTAYTPYHRNVYQIPEAIRNLPGYGWSAGTAKNYVDYENKRYVQCVQSVDLGTLTWTYGNLPFGWGDNQWFSAPIQSIKVISTNTQLANVLCKKYTTRCAYVADGNDFFRVDKSIGQHQDAARVTVLDTAYTDAAAFKQAMQGVILYYELANPIVTDISTLIPDDFLRNIEVEAGGSITFKNSNGDSYCIPVPSEEEYVVKLSEVGGSV
ncbi:hypothetical protein [Ruminococcus sp.]|uniref:hypothetical protein n=1 Tax=Ruminococcus sp. TaxID=41978 RepID=UPI00257F3AF9|nr:hypothetical protein [Ruminococcus sp.]